MGTAMTTPTMATTTPMVTDAALLQLIWLASPALPVGTFSYSEGLEAAIDGGHAPDEAGVGNWLLQQLQLAQVRSELAATAAAWRAWEDHDRARIEALNAWVLATRESAEFRLQTEQTGRSLTEWLRQRLPDDDPRLTTLQALAPAPAWPVAAALAGWRTGAPLRAGLLALAFGWAENMVQAAVKAVPLGQSAGQRLLAQLADAIPAAVDQALATDDTTRQAFTPMLAILSAQHEGQYSRLFRS